MTFKIKSVKKKSMHDQFHGYKNYKNFEVLEKDIRKNGLKDYFKVNGIVYTQEEYDESGKQVLYANKRTNSGFRVNTSDRYKEGFGDAKVEFDNNWGFYRDDISYLD